MLIARYRHPDRAQTADLIRQDAKQAGFLADESWQDHQSGAGERGVALGDDAVAAEHQVGIGNELLQPPDGLDRNHLRDVADVTMGLELRARSRQAMIRAIALRSIEIDRGFSDLLADQAGNQWIEETQENVGLLFQEIDDMWVAKQFDTDAGVIPRDVLDTPGEITACQPLHRGDADGSRLRSDGSPQLLVQGCGVDFHLADMFEKVLDFRAGANAAIGSVK